MEKTVTERGRNLVLRLAINNGTDKMQYHVGSGVVGTDILRLPGIQITPTNGYRLVQWSVNELDPDEGGHARTHFVSHYIGWVDIPINLLPLTPS